VRENRWANNGKRTPTAAPRLQPSPSRADLRSPKCRVQRWRSTHELSSVQRTERPVLWMRRRSKKAGCGNSHRRWMSGGHVSTPVSCQINNWLQILRPSQQIPHRSDLIISRRFSSNWFPVSLPAFEDYKNLMPSVNLSPGFRHSGSLSKAMDTEQLDLA